VSTRRIERAELVVLLAALIFAFGAAAAGFRGDWLWVAVGAFCCVGLVVYRTWRWL
jgi:hypothetical protein